MSKSDLSVIRPKLMAFLFCKHIEGVSNKPTGGLKTLTGIFDEVRAPSVPCTGEFEKAFWIYLRFVGGKGKQTLRFNFQSPSGKILLLPMEISFELHDLDRFHDVAIKLDNVVFEEFGTYKVRVDLNDNSIAEHPLPVIKTG